MSAPKATLDSSFLYSLSDLLKDSERVRITYAQRHFKSTFGSTYFMSKNNEVKLAKSTKKEPRKERFPWDLGLIFVKPMKYALISRFNIFKTEKEIYGLQPTYSL